MLMSWSLLPLLLWDLLALSEQAYYISEGSETMRRAAMDIPSEGGACPWGHPGLPSSDQLALTTRTTQIT